MLDTLALARELKDAGIDPPHADAIAHVVRQAAEHADPATRADLGALRAEVRADLAEVRADITEVRAEVRADITAVRSDLDTLRTEVRADLAALEARLIKWMIGVALTAAGVVVAVLRMLG